MTQSELLVTVYGFLYIVIILGPVLEYLRIIKKGIGTNVMLAACGLMVLMYGYSLMSLGLSSYGKRTEGVKQSAINPSQTTVAITGSLKGLSPVDRREIIKELETHIDNKMDGRYLKYSEFINWLALPLLLIIVQIYFTSKRSAS